MNTNKINIFNDDCIEVLKNLPENSVDLVVTDPPYIVKTEGGGVEPLAIKTESGTQK